MPRKLPHAPEHSKPLHSPPSPSSDPTTMDDLDPSLVPLTLHKDLLLLLPLELVHKILALLTPRQLCTLARVSRRWKRLVHEDLKQFWWGLCMDGFWEREARPLEMTKVDRKRDWKSVWVEVVGREQAKMGKKAEFVGVEEGGPWSVSPAAAATANTYVAAADPRWASQPAGKLEMRAYYKSIRSKPKGKKPVHVLREWEWE